MINNDNPLVSILMPAYNCAKFVELSIKSILAQTYSNWELLVADDCSLDSTKKVIDGFDDLRILRFHNEKNSGYLKTWNKLIGKAKGDYITFQDADDFSDCNRIGKLISAFNQNNDISIIGSNVERIDEFGHRVSISNFALAHSELYALIPDKFDFVGSALMIKREVYSEIGGYHEFFDRIGSEDHYWIMKILEKFRAINIPDVLYSYRLNPNSISGHLSDNYRKMISGPMIKILANEIREGKKDCLEANDQKRIQNYVEELEAPYKQDSSYIYQVLAKRYFNSGEEKKGIKMQYFNLCKKPTYSKLKDLIYFVKTYLKLKYSSKISNE